MAKPDIPVDPLNFNLLPSNGVDRELTIRRHLCDTYIHLREVGCGVGATMFYVDGDTNIRVWAKRALKFYNWKQQKNFNLEKVVRLNSFASSRYLTFYARSAESDERCLFRAVVRGPNVLLCEIRDDEKITIPADHPEICFEEDQPPPPCFSGSNVQRGYKLADGCAGSSDEGRDCTTYLTSVMCFVRMVVLVVLMIAAVAKLLVMVVSCCKVEFGIRNYD